MNRRISSYYGNPTTKTVWKEEMEDHIFVCDNSTASSKVGTYRHPQRKHIVQAKIVASLTQNEVGALHKNRFTAIEWSWTSSCSLHEMLLGPVSCYLVLQKFHARCYQNKARKVQ